MNYFFYTILVVILNFSQVESYDVPPANFYRRAYLSALLPTVTIKIDIGRNEVVGLSLPFDYSTNADTNFYMGVHLSWELKKPGINYNRDSSNVQWQNNMEDLNPNYTEGLRDVTTEQAAVFEVPLNLTTTDQGDTE